MRGEDPASVALRGDGALVSAMHLAGIAATCLAVAACAAATPPERGAAAGGTRGAPGASVAAARDAATAGARTYSGTYSCEGCIERTLTVTIFADGSYRLREVPARGEPLQEQGRWNAPREAPGRLVLESAAGERVLQRTAPDSLTIVDPQGRELHGLVGGVLARSASVDPLPVSRRLAGLYRSGGGQHLLVDCASGDTLAVLAGPPGSAQAALEAAWSELAPRDEENVLVIVRAHRAAPQAGMPAGAREAIVVDAFERAMRNGCEAAPHDAAPQRR